MVIDWAAIEFRHRNVPLTVITVTTYSTLHITEYVTIDRKGHTGNAEHCDTYQDVTQKNKASDV